MNESTTPEAPGPSDPQRVLVWHSEDDQSHVEPSLEQAARFLDVTTADVLAAIQSGDVLRGWFVDWEAPAASSASPETVTTT